MRLRPKGKQVRRSNWHANDDFWKPTAHKNEDLSIRLTAALYRHRLRVASLARLRPHVRRRTGRKEIISKIGHRVLEYLGQGNSWEFLAQRGKMAWFDQDGKDS